MNDCAAFRTALAEDAAACDWPAWNSLRLIFADWLQERGDPEFNLARAKWECWKPEVRGVQVEGRIRGRSMIPSAATLVTNADLRIETFQREQSPGNSMSVAYASGWRLYAPPGLTPKIAYAAGHIRRLKLAVNAKPLLHFAPGRLEFISLSWPFGTLKFRPRYYFIYHHKSKTLGHKTTKPRLDISRLEHGFISLAMGPAKPREERLTLLERMEEADA